MTFKTTSYLTSVAVSFLLIGHSQAQLEFVDVGQSRGIFENVVEGGFGSGVAAFDYDQDGDIDLYLPQRFGAPDRLYLNDGEGSFEDISAESGIDESLGGRSALWFDFDDDHLVDLLIASDCFSPEDPDCMLNSTVRLYRQLPTGQFENVTVETGLDNSGIMEFFGHRSSLCCGDIDRDGDLDLLLGQWGGDLRLFINDSGFFVDKTEEHGIMNPSAPIEQDPWQSMMHDFDGDGWLDIYTAVDFLENQFWLNQGDGTFVNVAESSGTDVAFNDMGMTIGDYDNDGDFDIYVTNIFELGKHNLLLRNDSVPGDPRFVDVSRGARVANTGFGWGTTFFDANNDTLLDLAVTNGWFNGIGFDDKSRLFINNGHPAGNPNRFSARGITFSDVSETAGFDDELFGSCLISADLNRDGDLDLLQVCNPGSLDGPFRVLENLLHENATPDSNWLIVRPRQAHKNHWCIGAVVTVEIGDLRISRAISAGTSIHGQEPAEAFFGLGSATSVDRVIVRWPFGDETVWEGAKAGQIFDAVDADLDHNGLVDSDDMLTLRLMRGPCEEDCQADLNHDGIINRLDAVIMLSMFQRGD